MKLTDNKTENNRVEGFCLIKSVEKKTSSKNTVYLDLMLIDRGGEINAKIWEYNAGAHDALAPDKVVKIRGVVDIYQGREQLRIDKIRLSEPDDEIEMSELVPCSPYDSQWMYDELCGIADSFKNSDLKAIVSCLLEQYRDELLVCPAAVKMHHAFRGGLLYHTLTLIRLAEGLCPVYPFIDKDLLFAGIILHDSAKIFELSFTEAGVAGSYTVEGQLIGHLVKGAIELETASIKLGIPKEITLKLQHMVLSHHGEPDFGSPVRPLFIEAEVLNQLDTMDAKIYEMAQELEKVKPGEFTDRVWALDQRKLYKHTEKADNFKSKLD